MARFQKPQEKPSTPLLLAAERDEKPSGKAAVPLGRAQCHIRKDRYNKIVLFTIF
jgi:hypothetical protein